MPGGRRPKGTDGRANNGGDRQGTPGKSYENRSDLRTQKIQVAPNQEYGKGEAQRRSQQVVPLAGAPAVPTPSAAGAAAQAPNWAYPEDTPNLTDPTNRPHEPLEAGMPFGPGPGPSSPNTQGMSDVEVRLRALYMSAPTPQLRELIRQIDMGG